MKAVKWLVGLTSMVVVAGTVQATPGDTGGGSTERRMTAGPAIPAELQAQLDSARATRELLLNDLKALLEANVGATAEERAVLVEKWRETNATTLEAQRTAMQAVRQDIREWRVENRPQQVKIADGTCKDSGQLCENDTDALMTQLKDQHQARKQSMTQIREQLINTADETTRKQIIAQNREQRMQEAQQARTETRTRSEQTSRDESVAALRGQLQEDAQTLRSQTRLLDREGTATSLEADRDTVRDTLRDQARDQDRDRISP